MNKSKNQRKLFMQKLLTVKLWQSELEWYILWIRTIGLSGASFRPTVSSFKVVGGETSFHLSTLLVFQCSLWFDVPRLSFSI